MPYPTTPRSCPGRPPDATRGGLAYHVTWSLRRSQPDLSPPERALVAGALRECEEDRYELLAWSVMNDHVQVLLRPRAGRPLEHTIAWWKSVTSQRMYQTFGRRGMIWTDERFDRVLRCRTDQETRAESILGSAGRRWPGLTRYAWCGLGKAGQRELRIRHGRIAAG